MMVNLHEWELTERAKKQGWEEGKIEGEKYGAEQIARCTNLSLEKVLELKIS